MSGAAPRPDPFPPRSPNPPKPSPGFHGAVTEFKRRLIEATLAQLGGNRTQAARALGLQRTYLLRLMREFGVNVPRQAAPAGLQSRAAAVAGERQRAVR
ncbi:MAG: hypothetical protein HYU42_03570 [Candidatus Rokubacteria bacterium]|nr:hypothetical protein [Candidatus Rokubacteria bacterium]MBI3107465.1 hypothetical protein [Candidatus Rokubacteria bacterium]